MTNPVFDAQQPAAEPEPPAAQPPVEFDVYTPVFPPQQTAPAPVEPMGPVAPPKPKKTGIVVLSVFLVLFFGAAGALGVLFAQEKDRSAGLTKQVEGKDREIADLTKKAQNSKDDALRAADLQKQAEAAQKKAEGDAATSQKCRDAARELRAAAIANDMNKGEAAGREIFTHC
ncbi:hypothetical protein ACIA8G_41265 [Lentzea sp. NPDC051213]|uniref:hypothetical protein n=1 Tax=Lentzea sp. NPDC051213 TaxID=3364126 RepID=UPI0037AD9CF9